MEFEQNVSQILPYSREEYIDYFDDDFNDFKSVVHWHGVSLQMEPIRNEKLYSVPYDTVQESINLLEAAFKGIVSKLDQGLAWIINHDDKDMDWFLKDDGRLPAIRELFKRNGIPNSYRGCLIFFKDDLFIYAKELITYPYVFSYKNLDISHSKLQFIIKMTDHLTIDLLSIDETLIDKMIDEESLKRFVKIKYRNR